MSTEQQDAYAPNFSDNGIPSDTAAPIVTAAAADDSANITQIADGGDGITSTAESRGRNTPPADSGDAITAVANDGSYAPDAEALVDNGAITPLAIDDGEVTSAADVYTPSVIAVEPKTAEPTIAYLAPAAAQAHAAPATPYFEAQDNGYEALPQHRPGGEIAREIVETFLLTLLIFWVVNTITGRFRIEGSSMLPTMTEGEYVLINKLAYYLNQPERGDIIVLHYPRDPSRDFIKRVIALPGDTIEVADEQVRVNGTLLSEPYINAPPAYAGTWTVPADEYFVLGDNRNNSSDSHNWGFVPAVNIVGKGWVIYWPITAMERVPHYGHAVDAGVSVTSQ